MTTDVATAGAILGIGRSKAYELAKSGEFPVTVLRIGRRYLVPTRAYWRCWARSGCSATSADNLTIARFNYLAWNREGLAETAAADGSLSESAALPRQLRSSLPT
jgi:Helix-turn-helix domain